MEGHVHRPCAQCCLRHWFFYHPFPNHHTHKIIIFKLFRSLQLQFSGPTGINFRYSYSFVGLTGICLYSYCSVQLHKKMVRGIIFRKLQLQLHKKMVFKLKSADCKRGRRKGATSKNVKNRQKASKSFSTLFDNFRAGQKTSKIVKKYQKVFRHFSTIFARHLFSGPFCNPLIKM